MHTELPQQESCCIVQTLCCIVKGAWCEATRSPDMTVLHSVSIESLKMMSRLIEQHGTYSVRNQELPTCRQNSS